MKLSLDVQPHLGLGKIHLGASRAQIIDLLGEPDHREEFSADEEDEDTEFFEYEEFELELGFSAEDGDHLGVIRCGSDDLRFEDAEIIGTFIKDLQARRPSFQLDEDSDSDYVDDELDLSVSVARGRIISLSMFPAWSEEDEPIWPQA